VFGVLRIRLPRLPSGLGFAGLGVFGGNVGRYTGRRGDGREGYGEGWLREVEEETGAVWLGRLVRDGQGGDGAASGIKVGIGAGSSEGAEGVVRRGGEKGEVEWGKGKKYILDFELCGYEEFLRMCVREKKVGCVVLVSEEHDDVLGFKRGTLVDQGLVRRMYEAGVLCWGGDVRDREAWSGELDSQKRV
jgi:FAS-associated factor 2